MSSDAKVRSRDLGDITGNASKISVTGLLDRQLFRVLTRTIETSATLLCTLTGCPCKSERYGWRGTGQNKESSASG